MFKHRVFIIQVYTWCFCFELNHETQSQGSLFHILLHPICLIKIQKRVLFLFLWNLLS